MFMVLANNFIELFPKQLCKKKNLKISLQGGGKSLRSFIFIDDASQATLKIMKKGKIGETIIFLLTSSLVFMH